jgi:hypothetical protein
VKVGVCIAPDMRGYGDSSVPTASDAYALEEIVQEWSKCMIILEQSLRSGLGTTSVALSLGRLFKPDNMKCDSVCAKVRVFYVEPRLYLNISSSASSLLRRHTRLEAPASRSVTAGHDVEGRWPWRSRFTPGSETDEIRAVAANPPPLDHYCLFVRLRQMPCRYFPSSPLPIVASLYFSVHLWSLQINADSSS